MYQAGDDITDELDAQLAMAAAGGLSHAEQTALAEVLRRSPAARKRYAEYRHALALGTEAMAKQAPIAAPAHLQSRLLAAVKNEAARAAPARAQQKPGIAGWFMSLISVPSRGFALASLAGALTLGVLNLRLNERVNAVAAQQVAAQQALQTAQQGQTVAQQALKSAQDAQAAAQQALQAQQAAQKSQQQMASAILASPTLLNVQLGGSTLVNGRLLCALQQPGILALSGLAPGGNYQVRLTRAANGAQDDVDKFLAEPDGSAQLTFKGLVDWSQYNAIEVLDLANNKASVARGAIVYRERG